MPAKTITLRRSFTRWNEFTNGCERRYALDILDPEREESLALRKGKQVHRLAEGIIGWLSDGPPPDFDTIVWNSTVESGPCSREELEKYYDGICALLQKWKLHEVEQWINTEVAGMKWAGKIDLIAEDDKGKFVVDWKTCGTLTFIKGPVEAKRSLQLQVYCLATGLNRACFVYLPPSGVPKIVEAKFTKEQLAVTAARLRQYDKAILSRWIDAGAYLRGGNQVSLEDGLDLHPFKLAGSDYPFCKKGTCRHFKRCFGGDDGISDSWDPSLHEGTG